MYQELPSSNSRLDTPRECAKDVIRDYVQEGWTDAEITKGHMARECEAYAAQIGAMGGKVLDHQGRRHRVPSGEIIVTCCQGTPVFVRFPVAAIIAKITGETAGPPHKTLTEVFVEAEPEQPAPLTKRRRPVIYRSYNGGSCQNPDCGEPLGYIETDGGRDRLYCNDACRVAAYRKRKREKDRAATLRYHTELRDYWQEHGIRGEVLLRLQEILLQHGKAAAKAATDAVLVALAAQAQAGSQEQFKLIDEILLEGEAIGFPEVRLEDFRIPAGVGAWSDFGSLATLSILRQVRGYLYEREQQEQHKATARKHLEALGAQHAPRQE